MTGATQSLDLVLAGARIGQSARLRLNTQLARAFGLIGRRSTTIVARARLALAEPGRIRTR